MSSAHDADNQHQFQSYVNDLLSNGGATRHTIDFYVALRYERDHLLVLQQLTEEGKLEAELIADYDVNAKVQPHPTDAYRLRLVPPDDQLRSWVQPA